MWRGDPPGALTWEEFRYERPASAWAVDRAFDEAFDEDGLPPDGSGRYLLADSHWAAMIASLHQNRHRLRVTDIAGVAQVKAWRERCLRDTDYWVLYQVD